MAYGVQSSFLVKRESGRIQFSTEKYNLTSSNSFKAQGISNAKAIADDASLIKRGLDGLWSRDTPVGAGGLYPQWAIGDFRNSSHILTTGGITGRDLLESR